MLRSRFGESSGRPYVSATLGVGYSLLSNPFESFGIGGLAPTYIERARIAFVDANEHRV